MGRDRAKTGDDGVKKRIVVLGMVAALLVGLSPGVGSAAGTPMASADRIWISIPGGNASVSTVDPGTGRGFVLGSGNLQVVDVDTGIDDVATLTGPYGPPVAAFGSVFAGRDGAVWRIDPGTLMETTSWAAPSLSLSARLVAGGGGILWQTYEGLGSDQSRIYRLDPVTGTTTSSAGLHRLAGLAAGGDTVVGWTDSSGRLTQLTGAEPGPMVETGISDISHLAITADGSVVTAVDFENSRAVDFAMPGFVPTGDTYDIVGGTLAVATTAADGGAVAIVSAPTGANTDSTLRVYRRGSSAAVVDVDLPNWGFPSGTSLDFSADGKQVFFVVDGVPQEDRLPKLVVAELESDVVATAYPPVVGSRGGARAVVRASLGTGSSLTVDGDPVAVAVSPGAAGSRGGTVDDLAFTVPAMAPGTKLVWLTNALGHARSAGPVHVVDLGPFTNAPWFVRKQMSDIAGAKATTQQVDAVMQQLIDGTTPGQFIAGLQVARGQATQRAALIRLYRAVFLRPPDTGGLRYWEGRMAGGTRLQQVAATLVASSEFQRRYGSLPNDVFVDQIYQNVLGRHPDPGGRAYWIRKLSSGTSRGVLVAQFAQSGEYVRKSTGDVQRIELRLAMLDRTPTEAQLAPLRGMDLDDVAWQFLNDPNYSTSG